MSASKKPDHPRVPQPAPDSRSKTDVMKPCAICGELTTRIVQSGGKFLPWCERHDTGARDGEAQIIH